MAKRSVGGNPQSAPVPAARHQPPAPAAQVTQPPPVEVPAPPGAGRPVEWDQDAPLHASLELVDNTYIKGRITSLGRAEVGLSHPAFCVSVVMSPDMLRRMVAGLTALLARLDNGKPPCNPS